MSSRKRSGFCPYKDFLYLFPYCSEEHRKELVERLYKQKRPFKLCEAEVPENLNKLTYGKLDDIRNATSSDDPISECAKILLGVEQSQLLYADVNDVFGFISFVMSELDKINKLFSDIKPSYSNEELAAGVQELDFGTFGVLDWYARRMGIVNQNDVRDVAWVRIYQCMLNDNILSEYERRLQKQFIDKNKSKR